MLKIYNSEEAAAVLQIDVRKIRVLLKEKTIAAYLEGKEYRIPEESLREYVARKMEQAKGA